MGADQYQYRPFVHPDDYLVVGLRRDHRGLGFQLQIFVPGRNACFRAKHSTRLPRRVPRWCRDGIGQYELSDIVAAQAKGIAGGSVFSWNWLPLFPIFIVYLISAVAETNRAPFDVAEGESEIVAGHHVEYSGFAFALFFLAEYIFMILIAALTSLMFLGGWLSPFPQS